MSELADYDMEIKHRPGAKHLNADGLSRSDDRICPEYRADVEPSDLPCGGCRHCQKAHTMWKDFHDNVDDVGSLVRSQTEPKVSAVSSANRGETELKLATASGDAIDRNSYNRSNSAEVRSALSSAISQSRENRVQATPERRTDSVSSSMDFSDDPQISRVPMVQLAITMRNIAKSDEKSYAIESDQYPIEVPEVDVAT